MEYISSSSSLCSDHHHRERRFNTMLNTEVDNNGTAKRVWRTSHQQEGEEAQVATKRQRTQLSSYCPPVRVETSQVYDILEPLVKQRLHQQSTAMSHLILTIMSKSMSDLKLQLCGIRALRTCGSSIVNPKEYVDVITSAMKQHSKSLRLQLEAVQSFRSWLRMDGSNPQILVESGAIQIILQSLCRDSKSLNLQYLGLDLLRVLSTSCQKARMCIAQQINFIPTFLTILKNNVQDPCIQQIGLSLLSYLVEYSDCRETILREGGCTYVLRTMQKYERDQTVQCNGSATLCWLIHSGDETSREELLTSSVRDEISTKLKGIMRHHVNNPYVFGNCMCILSEIQAFSNHATTTPTTANSSEEEESIVRHKQLLELVTNGIRRHVQSSKVQRNCLMYLRLLATDLPEIHSTLLDLDCLHLVLMAMKVHKKDADIQIQACGVLAAICNASNEGKAKVSASDCVEAVLTCQLEHKDSIRTQQAAAWFHSCMLQNTHNQPAVSAFGGDNMQVIETMLNGVL